MANKSTIKSDVKLIQFCQEILEEYLDEECKFKENISSSSERIFLLWPASGEWNSRIGAHGNHVPVVKLRNEFFLSCSFSFKPRDRKYVFKSISLQFFDDHKLLFRAEWDNWDVKKEESSEDEDIKQHPQPHWHLGDTTGVGITEKVADSFQKYVKKSSYSEFVDKQEERKKRDLSRLHFYMRMNDTVTQPYYYDLTDESEFKHWFGATLQSVDQELSYLSE